MNAIRFRATKGLLVGALGWHLGSASAVFAQTQSLQRFCSDGPSAAKLQSVDVPERGARLGPGFVLLPQATPAVACLNRGLAGEALGRQVAVAQRALGLDVELAVVLATHPIGCGNLFYIPRENDIRGIGYVKTDGTEVFDQEPDTKLQGIAFLNDIPYWETYPEEFRTAFLHEVGHRWGARIGALRDGQPQSLTGREGGHWSYFLDSAGSPLEGNQFGSSTTFETRTQAVRLKYSALDLYLMGVAAPEEVGEIRLLTSGSAPGLDCAGHTVSAASPPQICEPKALDGEWTKFGIEDVIAREGPRVPTFEEAPRTLSVGVFVLANLGQVWSSSSCHWVQRAVAERLTEFAQATGAKLQLVNAVGEGTPCSDLVRGIEDPSDLSPISGCSAANHFPDGQRAQNSAALFVALLVGLRRVATLRSALPGAKAAPVKRTFGKHPRVDLGCGMG
jgi:hypothetical protein